MSDDELQLILFIRDYPLITVEQLCRLTGRPMQSVARSLKKLLGQKNPLINRNEKRESINTPYVYAITRHAKADKNIGGSPIDLTSRKDKGLKHEQMITDVHIALKDFVMYWRQGKKTLWHNGIQPDAFFKLQKGEKRRSYFLEAEFGTNNLDDVLAKYQGYVKLHESIQKLNSEVERLEEEGASLDHLERKMRELHDWLPMKTFSVLTVCQTETAAQLLLKAVEERKILAAKFKRVYLFSFLPVTHCFITYDTTRYPLMDI